MEGTYNSFFVFLSYVVAVLASFTALELARRVVSSSGLASRVWLGSGSVVMGIGIWTMHFVGMLAFEMDMPFSYDVLITLLSLFVGIAASWFAIFIASRKSNNVLSLASAGIILGLGIAAMHYTGMAAMEMDAEIIYDPMIVTLSVVIAIIAAIAALWIVYTISKSKSAKILNYKIGAALIMGLAICGMHYTGMFAASYEPNGMYMEVHSNNNQWLGLTLAGAAIFILGLTHLTIFFDYKLSSQRKLGNELQKMVDDRTRELMNQADDLRKSKENIEHEMEVRKRAEEEAVRLSTLLDESLNEIFVFEIESLKILQVNKGACDNLGYSKDELLGSTIDLLSKEYDLHSFFRLIAPLINGKTERINFETLHRKADQSKYPVEVNLQLSRIPGYQVVVALVNDISERKKLESKLNHANKMESIGQLTAGVAHEINTPAQFVGDNLVFLSSSFDDFLVLYKKYEELVNYIEEYPEEKPDPIMFNDIRKANDVADVDYLIKEIPEALQQSLEGINHIANIVKAMKEFSHPGGSEKKPIDVNSCINSVITVASNEWKYAADIQTEFNEQLPSIPCYGQEINQALLNLLVNAAHAINEKREKGEYSKGKITISTNLDEKSVIIKITDNGTGIPEAIREKIFDPFFTTKEVGKGTGQGLSIAYKAIVEKLQGSLDLESEFGIGTTFTIRLPLGDDDNSHDLSHIHKNSSVMWSQRL